MDQLEASASEPKEEEIQDYLSVANEFDNSACIPKSICEILARGNRTTNQFENQILEYYRYNYKSLIKYLCHTTYGVIKHCTHAFIHLFLFYTLN